VVQVLDVLTRLLLLHSGADRPEALLDDHFRRTTPRPFASEEAREFIASLRRSHLDIPFLDEVLAYEEARLRALLEDRAQ